MQLAHQRKHEEAFFLVAVERGEALRRHVVAEVVVAGFADGTDAVDRFVDAVAGAEAVFAWWVGAVAEKNTALHTEGARDAGNPERCGREIQKADQVVVFRAGFYLWRLREVLGPLDNERDVQASVVTPVDAAGFLPAIVGEEDDHGIIGETIRAELFEDPADAAVEARDGVE